MRKILLFTFLFFTIGCIVKGQSIKERARSYSREGNFSAAKPLYIQCHENGDRDCTIEYAQLLLDRNLLEETPDQIFGLLEPLARKGDAEAQYLLGELYLVGRGVTKSCNRAISWFDQAINNRTATSTVRSKARNAKYEAEDECYSPPSTRNTPNTSRTTQRNVYPSQPDPYQDSYESYIESGHFFFLPGISFGSVTSFSAMAGYAKKMGGYVKIKSSFNSKDKNVETGSKDDFFYNGNKSKGRFSFYGGLLWRLSESVYMNTGVGYGNKWEQWETMDGSKVEIVEASFTGFDPEIGLLFRFGNFSFGGGLNYLIGNGVSTVEGNVSIGVVF